MKTIAFINNKGGVGKTASVTTIAHILATMFDKKVLVIDLDPQGNTSSRYSQIEFESLFRAILDHKEIETEKSVEDILRNSELDIHEAIKHTEYINLDIIPSHLTLSSVEEEIKADVRTPQQFKLKYQLDKLKDEYDYCLLDCSPSISLLNINGLVASQEVYIPLRSDGDSCIGLAITKNLVDTVATYNPVLKIEGVFLTQFNAQKNVARVVYEFLKETLPLYGIPLLPIQVGVTKYLEENTFEQKPLLALDSRARKCNASQSYIQISQYILAPNKKTFLKRYNQIYK